MSFNVMTPDNDCISIPPVSMLKAGLRDRIRKRGLGLNPNSLCRVNVASITLSSELPFLLVDMKGDPIFKCKKKFFAGRHGLPDMEGDPIFSITSPSVWSSLVSTQKQNGDRISLQEYPISVDEQGRNFFKTGTKTAGCSITPM